MFVFIGLFGRDVLELLEISVFFVILFRSFGNVKCYVFGRGATLLQRVRKIGILLWTVGKVQISQAVNPAERIVLLLRITAAENKFLRREHL